ncbi:MAG: VCBS repeat-containing protein [Planctomycetaceae bacterium]|nr:VCBS repeat-containing protein [Planctomycetaceae bacterium]
MRTLPLIDWVQSAFHTSRRRKRAVLTHRLEFLEDRTLLAAFTVDTLFDTPDASPGDGVAEDAMGRKTLRAAIDEAEALPGADSISIVVSGTITRTFGSAGFIITEDLSISATGADELIYDASGSGFVFRIFSTATVDMSGMTLTGGSTGDFIGGSGIGILGGNVTLTEMAIVGNSRTDVSGGGIGFGTDFTMGGASGSLTIVDSLIAGNTASGGGGISIGNGAGPVLIVNSTISGNTVTTDGAGIHYTQGNGSSLETRNVTITANHIDSDGATQIGGGIYVQGSVSSMEVLPTLKNTIVAGNLHGSTTITPDDINGSGLAAMAPYVNVASSNTLIGDAATSGGLTNGVNANIVGVGGTGTIVTSTILDTLADNGGRTATHRLLPGSPAVNAGSNALAIAPNSTTLMFDQRGTGFDRILVGTVDIGAYESTFAGTPPVVEDVIVFDDSSGRWKVGISDGSSFTWMNGPKWSAAAGWQTFSGDVNGDGFVDGIGFNSSNKMFVALNNGSGGLTTVSGGGFSSSATFSNVMVGDYNGDGRTDLVAQLSSGEWYSRRFNGSTFETAFFGKFTPVGWEGFLTGDFNGDGTDDIIGARDSMDMSKANFIYGISNDIPMVGRRFAAVFAGAFGESFASAGWNNFLIGDWNADGKDDFIAKHSSGQFWYATTIGTPITTPDLGANRLLLSPGKKFAPATYAGDFYVGDFDGNGLDDIITHNPNLSNAFDGLIGVGLTSFSGTPSMTISLWGDWDDMTTWGPEIVGDFNGDGLDDLAGLDTGGQLSYVSLSTGSTFGPHTLWGAITGPDDLLFADLADSGQLG